MPRRIDVELTSAKDDGTWTWRAAGAKQPKGVVPDSLLYEGAKVGDVVTAEADFDVDGVTITSVRPPKQKAGRSGLLELASTDDDFKPVITNWSEKRGGRDRDPYGERPPRGDRPGGGGGGGGGRGGPGGRGARPTMDWRARATPPPPAGGERGGDRGRRSGPGGPGGPGGGRDRDRDRGRDRDRAPRAEDGAGLGTGGPTTDRRGGSRPDSANRGRPGRPGGPEREARPRAKRLSPGHTHRTAVLESLSPEQRPVAEQVLRGGIPAVRRAIEEQNSAAKASGQPEIKPGPLVAMAEELLPRLKTAEWRDRAEAAMADVDELGLRDLRSVVSGADAAARDEETRALAASLREALDRRLKKQHDDWLGEIRSALDDHRLVRALRVASRPPDPSLRLPAEVAQHLAGAASEAMAADTPPERWAALLEAVAASPVRTTVKPAALPENPGEALLNAARQQAGRIPALTQLLGISMPPPPGPVRRIPPKPQPGGGGGGGSGGSGGGGGGRPPRPPAPRAAEAAPAEVAPMAAEPAVQPEVLMTASTEPTVGTADAPAADAAAATPDVAPTATDGATAADEPAVVEASAAPEPPAVTDESPSPPTPVHDAMLADVPTPPEATDAVAPVEPQVSTIAEDVDAPSDASVVADDSGPGSGEG